MANGRQSPAELLEPGRPLTLSGVADGAEGLVVADLARAVAARPRAPATSLVVVCRDGPRMAALARALDVLRARHGGARIPGLGLPAVRPGVAACRRGGAAHDRAGAARARQRPRPAVDPAHHRQCRAPARAGARDGGDAIAVGRARQRARHGGHHPLARAQRLHPRLDRARARRLCGARRHHRSLRARAWRSRCGSISSATAGIDPQLRSGDPAQHRPVARARSRSGRGIPAHHRDDPALPPRLCGSVRRADAGRSAL